jgi:hypothetical protein
MSLRRFLGLLMVANIAILLRQFAGYLGGQDIHWWASLAAIVTTVGATSALVVSRARGRMRRKRLERKATLELADAERRKLDADFQRGRGELGTVDHAINVSAAPRRLTELTRLVVPLVLRVEQEIVRATDILPVSGDPNYFSEKQRIETDVARTIHPLVLEVEKAAAQFSENTSLFINGNRTLIADLPIGGDGGLRELRALPSAYAGQFAEVFAMGSKALQDRLRFMRGLHGYQQDLTRMTSRQAAALKEMSTCCDRIHRFCSVEIKKLVDARVSTETKQ